MARPARTRQPGVTHPSTPPGRDGQPPHLQVVGPDWQTGEGDDERSTDVHDPEAWTTVSPGGYARNRYYMKATDGHGHSDNVQVKITTQIGGMIGALVSSGTTAYRTNQDFIRDAIVHRLHDLHEMHKAGAIAGQLPEIIAKAAMEQAKVERESRGDLCASTATEIEVLIQRGQTDDIVHVLDGLEAISTNWPEFDQRAARQVIARGNEALKRALS